MNLLSEHPLAYEQRELIQKYRVPLAEGSILVELPEIQTDPETGRRFTRASGKCWIQSNASRLFLCFENS